MNTIDKAVSSDNINDNNIESNISNTSNTPNTSNTSNTPNASNAPNTPNASNASNASNTNAAIATVTNKERTPEQIKAKEEILTQVEYYFGDSNLGRDKFLNELRSKDPKGWCPLNIIHTFKKMQVYNDHELIVEALRESPELLEVDEAGKRVRRKTPLLIEIPEHVKHSAIWRTIYAKGFSEELSWSFETEVKKFFSQYGSVQKIFPRRESTGNFKGSFFIEFANHEEAKKVKEMELNFHDTKLLMMMKFDYCEMKCVEKGLDPNTMRRQKPYKPKFCDRERDRNPKIKNNSLIQFSSVGENINCLSIKELVEQKYGKVVYVQYKEKEPSGIIELMESKADTVVKSMLQDNFTLGSDKSTFKVLSGSEESKYFDGKKEFFLNKKRKNDTNYTTNKNKKNKNNTKRNTNQNKNNNDNINHSNNDINDCHDSNNNSNNNNNNVNVNDDIAISNNNNTNNNDSGTSTNSNVEVSSEIIVKNNENDNKDVNESAVKIIKTDNNNSTSSNTEGNSKVININNDDDDKDVDQRPVKKIKTVKENSDNSNAEDDKKIIEINNDNDGKDVDERSIETINTVN